MAEMVKYLREWNKQTILVRPTKWNGAEEVAPWDCLDITDARLDYQKYTLPPFDVNDYIKDGIFIPPRDAQKDYIKNPVVKEIQNNYQLYRSVPFSTKHANNDRMANPFFGCCVVAAEALYFLTPESDEPHLYRAKDFEGEWHWWVKSNLLPEPDKKLISGWKKNPVIIQDATLLQFEDTGHFPPYENGRKTALLGWKNSPSKRTLDLIERITPSSRRYKCFDKSYAPPSTGASLDDFFTDGVSQ